MSRSLVSTSVVVASWGLLFAACAGSSPTGGKVGESCTRHSDCASNLSCYSGVCVAVSVAPVTDGGAESEAGTGVPGPNFSKEGESCSRRADCESGLKCVAQTCVKESTPPVMTNVAVGSRGETCQVVSDCASGLTCVPVGASGLGRCDLVAFGLVPTGMVCGAECKAAADCCELPSNLFVGINPVNSCADLRAQLGATPETCANTVGDLGRACFLFKTYCDCGDSWQCTAGQCVFTKPCDSQAPDILMHSCPTLTRSNRGLPTCDVMNKKCQAPMGAAGCTTDASCDGKQMADVAELCSAGECTCVADGARCYRRCDEDVDCEFGFRCDATKKVCVPTMACEKDAQCASLLNDVTAKCVTGACKVPCASDQQCSPSGLPERGGFNDNVCYMGFCTNVGCQSDNECVRFSGGRNIRVFCTAPAPAVAGAQYRSAYTD